MEEAKTKKILLADDSSSFLHFEKVLLTSTGHEILTAVNGLEALKICREERPDIVFLDVNMPEMNGYEVCRMIKNDPELKEIAVIMVTTLGKEENVDQGYQMGCDDYLFKPVRKNILLEKIDKFA